MEHWPGHERRDRTQSTDKLKDKRKERCLESSFWRWPHLEHGLIGRTTLVSKDGRIQWSSLIDTLRDTRWSLSGRPTKIFPETRSPQANMREHSSRQRAGKGLQYLRAYFPDAEFPSELLEHTLEADASEIRRLKTFDPFLGNLMEIVPSHHSQGESTVVFPMGELSRELNMSRFRSDRFGNVLLNPAGSPSFVFETPILQISSPVGLSEWIATPSSALLVRTHTSSSLLRVERSKVTKELDITRSETGGIPIVDSKILASGPDIVVVNRSGKVFKCTTRCGSKAMQLIGGHDVNNDDYFWQLGITGRSDECFLTSCKTVKHIDLRSPNSAADVFSLDHPSAIVTSFESPMHDYMSRITTTSDVIWLDDRFRKRPLLSFKHYRSFDRTLRVLTANLSGASFSLLTSRRNGFVTLYDVNAGSDGLLHCNSIPSCLPHDGPMFTVYDGHALAVLPSGVELTFLRLCQRGSIRRQDIRLARPGEVQPEVGQEGRVTHQRDDDVQTLEKQANELQIDFGPAGGRHYTEVNLRGAYEEMFAITDNTRENMDRDAFADTLARLPDVWQDIQETTENMLTTLDVISDTKGGNRHTSHTKLFASSNIDPKQALDVLSCGPVAIQKLATLAQWHYNIQDTSIPGLAYHSVNYSTLHEYLKGLDPALGAERHGASVQRETEAREELVIDLALSNDAYSARPGPSAKLHGPISNATAHPMEISYSEEPPEVSFGYFHPVRKAGTAHYVNKDRDREQEPVSSPLGIRLLLAEWEMGTDPKDYTYRDPYGLADIDAQPVPQYRRLPAALPITETTQIPLQRPPLVVAAATQPSTVRAVESMPVMIQSQTVQRTHSGQSSFEVFSQQPMTSTQTLPGPFGGRPGAGMKPGKKRVGGF